MNRGHTPHQPQQEPSMKSGTSAYARHTLELKPAAQPQVPAGPKIHLHLANRARAPEVAPAPQPATVQPTMAPQPIQPMAPVPEKPNATSKLAQFKAKAVKAYQELGLQDIVASKLAKLRANKQNTSPSQTKDASAKNAQSFGWPMAKTVGAYFLVVGLAVGGAIYGSQHVFSILSKTMLNMGQEMALDSSSQHIQTAASTY